MVQNTYVFLVGIPGAMEYTVEYTVEYTEEYVMGVYWRTCAPVSSLDDNCTL